MLGEGGTRGVFTLRSLEGRVASTSFGIVCVSITVHMMHLDGLLSISCMGLVSSSMVGEVDGGGAGLIRSCLVDRRFMSSWYR